MMQPGVLIVTGDEAIYGSGHGERMHLVALELKKHQIDVQKLCLDSHETAEVPLPYSIAILDRRDTAFNAFVHANDCYKIAVDNRGAGRDEANLAVDLLPHLSMDKQSYAEALRAVVLPKSLTAKPSKANVASLTLHESLAAATACSDFTPPPERMPAEDYRRALAASQKPALYFGQALFEALYLGLDVQLYPISDYHNKLSIDLYSRFLIEPNLLGVLDGGGLERFVDKILITLKMGF